MTCNLVALCVDADNPARLAAFWGAVLGWRTCGTGDRAAELQPDDDTGFHLRFVGSDAVRTGPLRTHLDLTSSSLEDQQATVARELDLGGRHHDVGQLPEERHVVLADPEGNEFCVIEPGSTFLAECGFVGALAGDGSQAVGYFWSRALGWPLVWDQDGETAIRSPDGGPKLTWGGPPVAPKLGRNRVRYELAPADGGDHLVEVQRLIGLGASLIEPAAADKPAQLVDPDGNEFSLSAG